MKKLIFAVAVISASFTYAQQTPKKECCKDKKECTKKDKKHCDKKHKDCKDKKNCEKK